MEQEHIAHFKNKLESERLLVEKELEQLGHKDESGAWEVTSEDVDEAATESDELADREEDFEEKQSEMTALEQHLSDIDLALGKIEGGTYGECETCGEEIELDRLEANPSARTCKAHMGE